MRALNALLLFEFAAPLSFITVPAFKEEDTVLPLLHIGHAVTKLLVQPT